MVPQERGIKKGGTATEIDSDGGREPESWNARETVRKLKCRDIERRKRKRERWERGGQMQGERGGRREREGGGGGGGGTQIEKERHEPKDGNRATERENCVV